MRIRTWVLGLGAWALGIGTKTQDLKPKTKDPLIRLSRVMLKHNPRLPFTRDRKTC